MNKEEARKSLLDILDISASVVTAENPELDRLDIYNTLQLLSWKIIEKQPSLASSVIMNRRGTIR